MMASFDSSNVSKMIVVRIDISLYTFTCYTSWEIPRRVQKANHFLTSYSKVLTQSCLVYMKQTEVYDHFITQTCLSNETVWHRRCWYMRYEISVHDFIVGVFWLITRNWLYTDRLIRQTKQWKKNNMITRKIMLSFFGLQQNSQNHEYSQRHHQTR